MDIDERLKAQDDTIMNLSKEVQSLQALVGQNNKALADFIELAQAFRFGMKLLALAERTAVFITKLTLAGGTLWAGWRFLIKESLAAIIKR